VRRTLTAVLLLLAATLPAVAAASWWAYAEATDTQRFLETADPLTTDPAVRRAVTDELVAVADAQLGALPLPVPGGTAALRARVRSIADTLASTAAYRQAWRAVLRTTHARFVARVKGGVVAPLTLDLAPVATVLRERVRAAGLPAAVGDAIRDPRPVVLADRSEVRRARDAVEAVRIVRAVAIPAAVLSLLLVLLTAPSSVSGLLRVAACLAISTILLVAAWLVARNAVASGSSSRDLSVAVYEVVTRPLRKWVLGGAAGALALTLTGGTLSATRRR
jgi:hypothetical protein